MCQPIALVCCTRDDFWEEATRLAPGKEPPMRMILAKEDAMKTSRVVMPLCDS